MAQRFQSCQLKRVLFGLHETQYQWQVIVNESFVHVILGDRNPIGRRFRYLANEAYRDPEQEPGPA